jgi:glucose/arabinose dehydrogenase
MQFMHLYAISTRWLDMSINAENIDRLGGYVDVVDLFPRYVEIFANFRQVLSIGRLHRHVRDPVGTLAKLYGHYPGALEMLEFRRASTFTCLLLISVGLVACGGGGSAGGSLPPATSPPPPAAMPEIVTAQVFTSLPAFTRPVAMKQAPGDTTRWFVAEKDGVIRVFANNADSSSSSIFFDISAIVASTGEGGLLGFVFHPDFPTTPEVFVSYTRGAPFRSFVSRFYSTDNGQTLSPLVEDVIIENPQPATNHNGGDIAFGPDNLLYVGFGDGGGSGDPNENGQNTLNIHSAIVRLDVDGGSPYEIPPGNPFAMNAPCIQGVGAAACPEIFAWGFRNPWRFSFDRLTGRLWAGDVGQNAWEEIDLVEVGENYGWNDREGAHCFDPATGCADTFREPHAEYDHSLGRSVTGGFVYRGSELPDLAGWYVFGDFVSGRIFAFEQDAAAGVTPEELLDTSHSIVSFAEDNAGELYLVDFGVGTIHKIENAQ